jgi:uncharacterized protein YeaO (DUF488 family)
MPNPRPSGRPRDRRSGTPLKLSTYAYRDKRRRGEGLRLGCARYPVRGVRKSRYAAEDIMDVWLPTVAPSRELLGWARSHDLEDPKVWATYLRRYRGEMKRTEAHQTIEALARLAQRTPISIGCYCHGAHCHRFELERLIRTAAAGQS